MGAKNVKANKGLFLHHAKRKPGCIFQGLLDIPPFLLDMKVTQKSFNFARKFSLPFYFVSAADGTNVVKLFNDAIKLALTYKQNSGDFMDEVMQELESFDLEKRSENLSDQEESNHEEKPPPS
uniref:Rab-like protein 2A n=1 Tax=Pavo cristatus TaxID=9049 RepID=A0A8C9FLU2_PAVCR